MAAAHGGWLVATDTGGTFTDFVAYHPETGDLRVAKSLTTYDDLVDGVMDGFTKGGITPEQSTLVRHGTTLVINAFLQRAGARTALVTTHGFRDVLEIRRGNRPEPFRLDYRRDPVLVPRNLRFTVRERIGGDGSVVEPLDEQELERVADRLAALRVEAVAVSFINSYLNPVHERRAADLLDHRLPDVYITAGTDLTQEWYEYERTSTAAANAFVGPRLRRYVQHHRQHLGDGPRLVLMGSNGGTTSVDRALAEPVMLVESGPVGGCIGTAAYAAALGINKAIAFDMGGTTAKCALIEDGRFDVRSPYYVGGYERGFPIRGAVVDIVEVGAGGGSIAHVDDQGRLHVGPESAGSDPGPAAYGLGGQAPTVTDANLTLGRIDGAGFIGGDMVLDGHAAELAIRERIAGRLGYEGEETVAHTAQGILDLCDITMAGAIKQITVERGRDPRDFALFVSGGGGPLHGTGLARELHIPRVIVPPDPGTFSALGMLLADARIDRTRTLVRPLTDEALADIRRVVDELIAEARKAMAQEVGETDIRFERQLELRYVGQKQSTAVRLPSLDSAGDVRRAFDETYRDRYGHANLASPAEIIGVLVTAIGAGKKPALEQVAARTAPGSRVASEPASGSRSGGGSPVPARRRPVYFAEAGGWVETPVYDRAALAPDQESAGPAVIEEYGATTLVGPRDSFRIGALGEIHITVAPGSGGAATN